MQNFIEYRIKKTKKFIIKVLQKVLKKRKLKGIFLKTSPTYNIKVGRKLRQHLGFLLL